MSWTLTRLSHQVPQAEIFLDVISTAYFIKGKTDKLDTTKMENFRTSQGTIKKMMTSGEIIS